MMVEQVFEDYGALRLVAGRPGDELVLVPRNQLTDLLDAYDTLRRQLPAEGSPKPSRRRRRGTAAEADG